MTTRATRKDREIAKKMREKGAKIVSNPAHRPLAYNDPAELELAIDHYFNYCDETKVPYTMSGLGYFLGMDRQSIMHYKDKAEYSNAIKRARDLVERSVEEKLLSGMPAAGIIFNMKNNFAWKDQSQLDVTTKGDKVFDSEAIKLAAKELLEKENDPSEDENK